MRAIISDIHANLEALEAVLADIRRLGITEIYCLGDIIGYGPNPCECIDKIVSSKLCLLGNHDQAALFDPEGFNASAERAVFWTRRQLESGTGPAADRRWEFLGELPRVHREPKFLFVHGSARNPLNEPVGHSFGSAGSTLIIRSSFPSRSSVHWLCKSISAMPAGAPKLPSIWNGPHKSNRFGNVRR